MKKHAPTLLALAVVASLSLAGPIHTWSVGEVITSTDLNAALSHIHGTMVGGHGPRLVNADVSGSAAIAHTKLAGPALLPKVWGTFDCASTPGTCSFLVGSATSSAVFNSTGTYTVTLPAARTNAVYGVMISEWADTSTSNITCHGSTQTTTTVDVRCSKSNPDAGATDVAADARFTFEILDDNN